MDQKLDIRNTVSETATNKLRNVCVTMNKFNVNKPPFFHIRPFTAKEKEDLKRRAVNFFSNQFIELAQFMRDFIYVDEFERQ